MVDQAVIEKLEAGFKKLEASDSKSLLKKFLTREVLDNLKTKSTGFGSTLLDVVQSGWFDNMKNRKFRLICLYTFRIRKSRFWYWIVRSRCRIVHRFCRSL